MIKNWMNMSNTAKLVLWCLAGFLMVSSLAFVEKKQNEILCRDVQVEINNQHENHFIEDRDILQLLNGNGGRKVIGAHCENLDLKELEENILKSSFIDDVTIYHDLKGTIFVDATLERPMTRIMIDRGEDVYVSEQGVVLPTSDRYVSRVMLVTGAFTSKLMKGNWEDEELAPYLELFKTIYEDDFLRAQIAQMEIDSKGEITILPQVGKQKIIFGNAEDIDSKLARFKLAFKKILPQKGWNSYETVNIKFKDQVICM